MKKEFKISKNIYEEIHEYVHPKLCSNNPKNDNKQILLLEESINALIAHKFESTDKISVTVQNILGSISVILKCEGEAFSLWDEDSFEFNDNDKDSDDENISIEDANNEIENTIRGILLNKMSDCIKYSRSGNRNTIIISSEKNEHREILITLISLILGIAFGLVLKMAVPSEASEALLDNVIQPFSRMFISGLRMIIAPIVFLAMVCCISQFKNITEIGKIGIKLIAMYVMTTILAICIGFTLFTAMPVGNPSIADDISSMISETMADEEEAEELIEAQEIADEGFSIVKTIEMIVPDNIVDPFREGNLLQILFLSILVGIGVSAISSEFPIVRTVFEGLNGAFMTIMSILCKFIPIAIFCNMAVLIYSTGLEVLTSILGFVILAIGGIICMMLMYLVLIAVVGGLNPIYFIKKYWKCSLTALTLSSSTAAMPVSIDSCKKMGIPDNITSFAIPLGSTINMDGSSLVMSIACLFLARIYDIKITPVLLMTILVSVVLLSLGAPSMAGADLAIIAILIAQIGIPAQAIVLIMGIDTILDMCQAMSNTTGDAAIALIVAKRSGKLNKEIYYNR